MTGNELASWDDYAAGHAITEQEAPQAFAAYLHEVTDGRWDGDVTRVGDEDPPSAAGAETPDEPTS